MDKDVKNENLAADVPDAAGVALCSWGSSTSGCGGASAKGQKI